MINIGGVIGVNIGVAICCLFIGLHYGVQRSLKRQRLSDEINDVYIHAIVQAFRAVPETEGKVTSSGVWKKGRMIRLDLDGRQTLVLGLSPDDMKTLNSGHAVVTRGTSYQESECIIVTAQTAASEIRTALEQVGIIPGRPHTTQGIQE